MNDYRILVVDDEEDLCEILKFILKTKVRSGYRNSARRGSEDGYQRYHLFFWT